MSGTASNASLVQPAAANGGLSGVALPAGTEVMFNDVGVSVCFESFMAHHFGSFKIKPSSILLPGSRSEVNVSCVGFVTVLPNAQFDQVICPKCLFKCFTEKKIEPRNYPIPLGEQDKDLFTDGMSSLVFQVVTEGDDCVVVQRVWGKLDGFVSPSCFHVSKQFLKFR